LEWARACFGHAGDGNIHTNLMVEDYDDPVIREKADAALDLLFTWVLENGGVITQGDQLETSRS